MDQHLNVPPFDPSFNDSIQFQNPYGRGGGDDGRRVGMPPPSPMSSIPPMPPYSQNHYFSSGGSDGGRRRGMPPPSPRSSFPPMSPYTQSHFSDGGRRRGMPPPSPRSSFPPVPPYSQNSFRSGGVDGGRRASMPSSSRRSSIPPIAPYSQFPPPHQPIGSQNFNPGPRLSRSLSQPSPGFSLESLPQLSPTASFYRDSPSAPVEAKKKTMDDLLSNYISFDTSESDGESSTKKKKLPPKVPVNKFTESEMEKILGSHKLSELAKSDPKRLRRILSNRNSAARSKQKLAQQVADLESQVETLEKQNNALSTQFSNLQKDNVELMGKKKELMIRIQGMEKQAQLREALVEHLTGEVRRLTVAIGEVSHYRNQYDISNMQPLDTEMFQQLNINQPQRNFGFEGTVL